MSFLHKLATIVTVSFLFNLKAMHCLSWQEVTWRGKFLPGISKDNTWKDVTIDVLMESTRVVL